MVLDSARVEKGEVISDNTVPKSYFPLFVENYYWALSIGDQAVRQEASQEIKLKSNESRQSNFYEVCQLKENSTPEFSWKDKTKLKLKEN